jgi:hypothetical protein
LLQDPEGFPVFLSDNFKKILSEYFGPIDLLILGCSVEMSEKLRWGKEGRDGRYVNMHWLFGFMSSFLVNKPRSKTLDLHTSLRLLLNVLDEHALRPNDLGPDIKVPDRLDPNWKLRLGPFSL